MKLAVETAKAWGRSPSSVIFGTDKGWSAEDSLLSVAFMLDEKAKCPGGCGHYADEAQDDNNEGGYEVQQVVCHACAARDQLRQANDSTPEPGTLTWIRKLTRKARGG